LLRPDLRRLLRTLAQTARPRLASSLETLLLLDALLDSLAHLLDGLEFGESESPLVGDVVNSAHGLCVLAVDTSGLDVEVVTELLELGDSGQFGDLDVHGGTEGGAQVGGAEGQVAETLALGE